MGSPATLSIPSGNVFAHGQKDILPSCFSLPAWSRPLLGACLLRKEGYYLAERRGLKQHLWCRCAEGGGKHSSNKRLVLLPRIRKPQSPGAKRRTSPPELEQNRIQYYSCKGENIIMYRHIRSCGPTSSGMYLKHQVQQFRNFQAVSLCCQEVQLI